MAEVVGILINHADHLSGLLAVAAGWNGHPCTVVDFHERHAAGSAGELGGMLQSDPLTGETAGDAKTGTNPAQLAQQLTALLRN